MAKRIDPKELGAICEEIAKNFYLRKGYKLLEKNYRVRMGEIDLILQKGKTIVFTEVKARTGRYFGLPQEAVTLKKQNLIRAIASLYLQKSKKTYEEIRFDVVAIILENGIPQIEFIPGAF